MVLMELIIFEAAQWWDWWINTIPYHTHSVSIEFASGISFSISIYCALNILWNNIFNATNHRRECSCCGRELSLVAHSQSSHRILLNQASIITICADYCWWCDLRRDLLLNNLSVNWDCLQQREKYRRCYFLLTYAYKAKQSHTENINKIFKDVCGHKLLPSMVF